MNVTPFRTPPLPLLLTLLAVGCASRAPSTGSPPPPLTLPATGWSPQRQALHALRRLAYGPSPRDWDEVRQQGVAAWVHAQLHPERLADDAVEHKLAALPTLTLDMQALAERYPPLQEQARELGVPLDSPEDRQALVRMVGRDSLPGQVTEELIASRLVRAVESRRQLREVLVDFWFNHFSVSADKGAVRWMVTAYERDALRPHVFGRFRDMLGATARHPAMLFYLDNHASVREGFQPRGRQGPQGLNENYARELLELHTLGVDGGYTQADVREVARAFTGWSIDKPRKAPAFHFRAAAHDPDEKGVLGLRLPAGGGLQDGERVLDMLARHPSTARHLATKLARKFVSDEPPAALVERLARVFLDTDGDLRAVYGALFTSPEFWSEEAWGAKTKTPLELVVSSVRATGGTTDGGPPLARAVEQMGEPLYRPAAPTGFEERAAPWVSAGALVHRLNFALALAAGRVRGTAVDGRALSPSPAPADVGAWVDALAPRLLFEPLSPQTRATLVAALAPGEEGRMADGEVRPLDARRVVGLLLGSPDFQKQ